MTQPTNQTSATTSANVSPVLRPPKIIPAKHVTARRSAAAKAAHTNKRGK